METRLNKYLARCGLGSRRKVESIITAGRIAINGKKVTGLGTTVGPEDRVTIDGTPIDRIKHDYYLVLNKPKGYLTTVSDDRNRPTVMSLVPEKFQRFGVYPVGRLDKDTEGLLLLTNDGDLAYRLTKPRFNIAKSYVVEIDRPLEDEDKKKICSGIYIHQLQIKTRKAEIDFLNDSGRLVKIVITEGKNRQIRYTFMNLGYKIKRLERTGYGMLTTKNLRKGTYRLLRKNEVGSLKKLAGMARDGA